jgi:hypothetical protein
MIFVAGRSSVKLPREAVGNLMELSGNGRGYPKATLEDVMEITGKS